MTVNHQRAQAFLSRAGQARRGIDALLERRQRCRELAARRGARSEALEGLERDIDRRIREYAALTREIEAVIDAAASPPEREVLRYRYLNGWDWRTIAGALGRGRSWVFQVHEEALNGVDERLNSGAAD